MAVWKGCLGQACCPWRPGVGFGGQGQGPRAESLQLSTFSTLGPSLILFLCLSLLAHCDMVPYSSAWPVRHCPVRSCLPSQLHDPALRLLCGLPGISILPAGTGGTQHSSSICPCTPRPPQALLFLISMAASAKLGSLPVCERDLSLSQSPSSRVGQEQSRGPECVWFNE